MRHASSPAPDEVLMGCAVQEAWRAYHKGEVPVGCVVARDGRVIARAHNENRALRDPTAHAEVLAIQRACRRLGAGRLDGCALYVTLEPCPMCAGAIVQARIARLIIGARDPAQGCAGSVYRIPEDPAFSHFCKSDAGVLAAACAAPLNAFFSRLRNA